MAELIVGIHPDRNGKASFSDRWIGYLRTRDVEIRLLNLLAPDALAQAAQCDGVMWRFIHTPQQIQVTPKVLYVIERYLGIPVFPNHDTARCYDDKVAQSYVFRALQVPTPQTWVFWDRASALHSAAFDILRQDGKPVITEVSYTSTQHQDPDYPGYWLSDLTWVPVQTWPELGQVEDFLVRVGAAKGIEVTRALP